MIFNMHLLMDVSRFLIRRFYPNKTVFTVIFNIFFFFLTCSPSRDYIDLPTTESQVPKAFLCWTCYPSSRLNLVTSWVLYFSPFRYQFYWLVYRSNISVKCLAQEHNIVVILAKRSPTPNQIRLSVAYPL